MDKDTQQGCAKEFGAWWYRKNTKGHCGNSNLNGIYQQTKGLRWAQWSQHQPNEPQYKATKTEMKIKPDYSG